MNKFETYQQIKAANKVSKDWAEMLGKPYRGGGGGTGKIVYLTLGRGEMKSPTIYYQYSNGDQNYHACPSVFIPTLEQVIQDEFPALLQKALLRQEEILQEAAKEALLERDELVAAASLETPGPYSQSLTQQEQGMSAVIDIVGDFARRAQNEKWDVRLSATGNPVVVIRQRPTDMMAFCSLVCADHQEAARVVALARGEK